MSIRTRDTGRLCRFHPELTGDSDAFSGCVPCTRHDGARPLTPRGVWYLAFGVLVVRMGGTDDKVLAGIRRGWYSGAVAIARDLDHF